MMMPRLFLLAGGLTGPGAALGLGLRLIADAAAVLYSIHLLRNLLLFTSLEAFKRLVSK